MATVKSSITTYTFPSELIHQIVDEVVSQTRPMPSLRNDTLLALCCVCQAFYASAQRHLLSHVTFPRFSGDIATVEKQSATFCELLDRNHSWPQDIRDICFSFDDQDTKKKNQGFITSWKDMVPRALGHVQEEGKVDTVQGFLRTALVADLLEAVSFEGYAVNGLSDQITWRSQERFGISTIFTAIQASTSLRTLKLVNLRAIPMRLLLGHFASKHFHELVLINSLPDTSNFLTTPTLDDDEQNQIQSCQTVGEINSLTMWRISYVQLFVILRHYLPPLPVGMQWKSPSFYFSKLRTLRMSIPWNLFETETAWKFLLGVSDTIENLALRGDFTAPPEYNIFHLDQLSKLKRLKLSADVSGQPESEIITNDNAARTLRGISVILKSLSSSNSAVTSISIELNIEAQENISRPILSVDECWKKMTLPELNWSEVDGILCRPHFLKLKDVSVRIATYYRDIRVGKTVYKDEILDPESILPCAYTQIPLLKVSYGGTLIYGAHRMKAHLDDLLLHS